MKQIAKVRFPNIWFGTFSASLIILLLILEHPVDYFFLGLTYLVMSCGVFILTSSIVGGLIHLFTRSKSDLASEEFYIAHTLLPANILWTNLSMVSTSYLYQTSVLNGGENDPIWIIAIAVFLFFTAIFLGFISGLLLIPRSVKRFTNTSEKIAYTNSLIRKWSNGSLIAVAMIFLIIIFFG